MNEQRTNPLSTADLAGREAAEPAGHEAIPSNTPDATADRTETVTAHEDALPLLPEDAASDFRERWSEIQTNFVDEPKDAVREADGLVAEVIQRVAQRFAEERQTLESQWDGGSEVSTEDLRQALQHYRSFFQRLLAA